MFMITSALGLTDLEDDEAIVIRTYRNNQFVTGNQIFDEKGHVVDVYDGPYLTIDFKTTSLLVNHLAMDEAVMVPEPVERMRAMSLMYNVRSTVNPLSGQQYGPNTLGLLSKVKKVFADE